MTDPITLDPEHPVVVPLARPGDLQRVGPTVRAMAESFDAPIAILTICGAEDDAPLEATRFEEAVDAFTATTDADVRFDLVVADDPVRELLERCSGAFVCMATGASPFKDGHYAGSYASALLARSTAPVLLVGPDVAEDGEFSVSEVVAAVSDDPDSRKVVPVARQLASIMMLPFSKVHIDCNSGIVYTSRYRDAGDRLADSVSALLGLPIGDDHVDETLLEHTDGLLIAVATSARQGLAWIAEGSVAFDVVAHSNAPVLVVGPHANPEWSRV